MVEGTFMPYFGFSYRIDKVQFGIHSSTMSKEYYKIDHSKIAIDHAQHLANFLVDEARLSSNLF